MLIMDGMNHNNFNYAYVKIIVNSINKIEIAFFIKFVESMSL